ncbi:hypothetical protein AB0J47_39850 [Nocardia sp. NPDC049737]|uniref:hypothetical protein n=1 Tax=Nocardia sp. NPDC049737 TaxID=3154358 RepID=UPI00341F2E67
MSIDPNENRSDEWVLAAYDAELDNDKGIAKAIAAMPAPLIPNGGRAEAWVKPTVEHANSLRDRARIWAPGIVGTATVGFLILGPVDVPLTGPLIAYGIGWAGFGWWTAAGRPGPSDSVVLLGRAIATGARWIAIAAVAVYSHIGKGAHAITTPMRRTAEAG